jgi:sugar phosphate isomerase/epimerase
MSTPMMQRAFSTIGCPELSLDEVLALACRHRMDQVELRALSGTVDLPAHFTATLGQPDALAARVRTSGLAIASLDTSFRLVTGSAKDREKLLHFIPWAEAARVPHLRVFDGGSQGDAADLDGARANLAWWREARRKGGWAVELAIETHDAFSNPDALARLLQAEPDCVILWDAHHTWRKGGEHPVETWRRLLGRTRHIHVKDSLPLPGDRLPYSYVMPGAGNFPMAALVEALNAAGYAGVLSLEWERLWHGELPDLEAALNHAEARSWW